MGTFQKLEESRRSYEVEDPGDKRCESRPDEARRTNGRGERKRVGVTLENRFENVSNCKRCSRLRISVVCSTVNAKSL